MKRKPKTKKAECMFHAPLNEPFATMEKQHLASQCQSYSSMQDKMCRQQCQSTVDQRDRRMYYDTHYPIIPHEADKHPSPSVPKGRLWHFPKSVVVGRVEIKETIPFAIHSAIIDALDHARAKHPHFANTDAEGGNVILEELLEVTDAALRVVRNINDQKNRDNLLTELAQLNATTIRMMERLLK